jgi:hypothetical protein
MGNVTMKMAAINEVSIGQSPNHLYLIKPSAEANLTEVRSTAVKALGLIGFIVLTCWVAFASSPESQVIVFVR